MGSGVTEILIILASVENICYLYYQFSNYNVEFGAELYDFVEQVSSGYICVAFVQTFMTL
jgi:hypothetical protein